VIRGVIFGDAEKLFLDMEAHGFLSRHATGGQGLEFDGAFEGLIGFVFDF
jgi:hypothetical protein